MMLKQFFTAITGISEDIDSEENQEAWDRQRDADVNDLDDEDLDDEDLDDEDLDDEDLDDEPTKKWWQL